MWHRPVSTGRSAPLANGRHLWPRLLVLLLLLAAAMARPVAADQPPEPVRLLLRVLHLKMQLQPTVRTFRQQDDGYVLEGVTFLRFTRDHADLLSITAKRILLQGTSRQDDGLTRYRHIRVEDLVLKAATGNGTMRMVVPRLDLARASVLPEDEARDEKERLAANTLMAAGLSIPEIRFEAPGVAPFYWRGIRMTWEGNRRTGAGEQRVEYGTLRLSLDALSALTKDRPEEKRQANALFRRLGLKELVITGYTETRTSWQPDNRLRADVSSIVRLERIGELAVQVENLALPLEMLQAVGERPWRNLPNAGNDAGQQPPLANPLANPQFMASLQRLSVLGLEIRWRDLGLTPALLDVEAEREGVDRQALVARLLEDMKATSAAFLPPDLATKLQEAFGAYLENPRTLRLALRGRNGVPVSLAGTVSLLLVSPQMLMNSVEFIIEANH